ncbi:putative deoxycytidylate deaminase [Tothia fuscella]|uniref:Deoxycytidylate deaminase n=1 Tax=Tothia fuscella TaxID=1048955 RepID=A0A9P4U4V3_9PEZI|nr:putative deoxycytidylate deaminase [Tothia fuscella]
MFIGVCGGICAGKSSIASYLINEHNFKRLHLNRTAPTPAVEKSEGNSKVPKDEDIEDGEIPSFENAEEMLDFVTADWRENWVTTDIWDENVLDVFMRRPFFLLISVDAPVSVRWERFRERCKSHNLTPPTLSDFVLRNDTHLYTPMSGLAPLLHRAQLRLLNSTNNISTLHTSLANLDLTNPSRLRPTWDQYFMRLASLASQRSNCMKRSVGCVLVRNNRVVSTGYNGTPRGMRNCNEGGCGRCNSKGVRAGVGLDTCLCIHAEENALLEAGRERVGGAGAGAGVLYCNTCPCLTCSVKIAQVGIGEVVYSTAYSVDSAAAAVFAEAGVKLRQFSPPRAGLIDLNPTQELPLLPSS